MITRPNIAVIGPKELVAFPRLNLYDIPSKVDTGADSSAIWVSDISVSKKGLTFVLFGPESHLYTGDKITVETYETTMVKNSSGVKENRYKIRLVVLVSGRKIRAWFTLSDRSTMKYPVLLGRKLLNNKFVVDVSKISLSKQNIRRKKKILIIVNDLDNLAKLRKIYKELFEEKAEVHFRSLKDFEFKLTSDHYEINDLIEHMNINSYDLVYIKANRKPKLLSIIAQYLIFYKVDVINKPNLNNYGRDNLTILSHLSQFNVPIAKTYLVNRNILSKYIQSHNDLKFPIILKEESSRKKIVKVVISKRSELKKIDEYPNLTFFAQPLINHQGLYRAYLYGGKLRFVTYSEDQKTESVLNTKDDKFKLIKEIASLTSRAVSLELGVVELIQNKDNKKLIVLSIEKDISLIDSKNMPQKEKQFINYVDKYLNR